MRRPLMPAIGIAILLAVQLVPGSGATHIFPFCATGTATLDATTLDARLCWNGTNLFLTGAGTATVELFEPQTGLPLGKTLIPARETFAGFVFEGCWDVAVDYKLESVAASDDWFRVRGDHRSNLCTGQRIVDLVGHYLVFDVAFFFAT